jgi:hypothetical protein
VKHAKSNSYILIALIVLFDLFILPWIIFFPIVVKLHGASHAFQIWDHSLSLFGGIRVIPRVWKDWRLYQILAGLLVAVTIIFNRKSQHDTHKEKNELPSGLSLDMHIRSVQHKEAIEMLNHMANEEYDPNQGKIIDLAKLAADGDVAKDAKIVEKTIKDMFRIVEEERQNEANRLGEKEQNPFKLTIELVPKNSWCNNLRKIVTQGQWHTIRQKVYADAEYRCEICGLTTNGLHCHETWRYNDAKHIQTLDKLIALCKDCHSVKHIGLAEMHAQEGKLDFNSIIQHFCAVNECTIKQFERYRDQQFTIWEKRSQYSWSLDISLLETIWPGMVSKTFIAASLDHRMNQSGAII